MVVPPVVEATVVRVIDGNTVEVDARPWPEMTIRTAVRLLAFDAPELRGKCEEERAAARAATAALERILPVGAPVQLAAVRAGKYAGRVVAQIVTADGRDPIETLLEDGHGRIYDGGRRKSWCG